ncbi:MAG: DUF2284 domain-containing protein [Alphaproteobacteria bacterium]|uniref:DUF2284 domain-containing protein n=1 Tax=Candidatus Nitrobium versatile TaxID=2884831 RepID=A0A953M3D1_9BACT|nr:DUF2284 domain-containing protein [Candidatus Nitrobium versatile]
MICSTPLHYLEQAEESVCSFCGETEPGHIRCPRGHFICDACHNKEAVKIIEDFSLATSSRDPLEIAEVMMSHPDLPMLGCQHAYIAGGALMAAIKNAGHPGITDGEIREVFRRTETQAHGGYCGLTGVCGVTPAIGACFAVLTGSKCGKDEEQRVTMEAANRVSDAITGLTGPSCCKAYVRTALETAVEYLQESRGLTLGRSSVPACRYPSKHPHGCREGRCPYFGGSVFVGAFATSPPETGSLSLKTAPQQSVPGKGIENLVQRARELGADKAKTISTDTVAVEEWVRWKCLYGCPFHGKDAYHPPCAPDAESTKKVMKEYSTAILMNSSKGKSLTEAAVRLEGEAYQAGYYKAFALTALSSGPAGAT